MTRPLAYYNEHDRHTAAWLRELSARNLIAPGEVDERSIEDVRASDLAGFTQCHFFAGIGVWSYALRCAGWADATPVWTGSCPCQPFSASGKRGGTDDQRHLWPAWFRLIRECRPDVCFGEQVASKDGLAWLDLVSSDLEGAGYAVGACDTCAAGVGAPHIRQRLYFVAESHADGRALVGTPRLHDHRQPGHDAARRGASSSVADTDSDRSSGECRDGASTPGATEGSLSQRWPEVVGMSEPVGGGESRGMADAHGDGTRQLARVVPSNEGEHEIGCARSDYPSLAGSAPRGVEHTARERPARGAEGRRETLDRFELASVSRELGDAKDERCGPESEPDASRAATREGERLVGVGAASVVGDTESRGRGERGHAALARDGGHADGAVVNGAMADAASGQYGQQRGESGRRSETEIGDSSPLAGFWRDAEWIDCSDGKARPIEPGAFPLVDGAPARVVRLRGYGDALCAPVAITFIEAYREVVAERLTLAEAANG